MPSPFKIIEKDENSPSRKVSGFEERRIERMAYFEKAWRENPDRFLREGSAIERDRVVRLSKFIDNCSPRLGQRSCDLACGAGHAAKWIARKGIEVDAVDLSSLALGRLKLDPLPTLRLVQDYVPYTKLPDDAYQLVVCTDFIGYLYPQEYRLLFSEIARLMKQNGHAIFSTAIDLNSEDALARFLQLAETEFEILNNSFAYDKLYIHLLDGFAWPGRLAKAADSPPYRKEAIEKRKGLRRALFKLFSAAPISYFWKAVSWISSPLHRFMKGNDALRRILQKTTRFFWQENGITHVICLAKRRSILNTDPRIVPHDVIEQKAKKTVWE